MTAAALGVESALVMLAVASVAAIQARAVRGAQRTTIQELCERRGRPERYTEIVAASETIAFIAASVVVVAAVGATLLMFPRLMAAGDRSLALEISAVLTWIGSAWLALVVVPMLLVRFAGPWIVVATWAVWRPIVGLIAPAVGSGWLLAFTLSLDDLILTQFVAGAQSQTLPMRVYSSVRLGVGPQINVLATLVVIIAACALVLSGWLTRRKV